MPKTNSQKKTPSLCGDVRTLLAILSNIARRVASKPTITRKPKPSKA